VSEQLLRTVIDWKSLSIANFALILTLIENLDREFGREFGRQDPKLVLYIFTAVESHRSPCGFRPLAERGGMRFRHSVTRQKIFI
jgi:hypothetical protein